MNSEGEDYRVVSSSIILGAMANGYALNLKQYLMGEIVNYFLGYDPVTSILDPNTETQLAGNFPNPFSSETTITVNLEQPGVVLVEIFNASGQKIKTITEGKMNREIRLKTGNTSTGFRMELSRFLTR